MRARVAVFRSPDPQVVARWYNVHGVGAVTPRRSDHEIGEKRGAEMMVRSAQGLQSLMPLYEGNYRSLAQLVPGLRSIQLPATYILSDLPRIRMSVLECCKYTALLAFTHSLAPGMNWVPEVSLKVRVCHDARVAEVIGYQGRSRFAAVYPYPNKNMYGVFEKRQVNRFLGEWLRFCRCSDPLPGVRA
jgi:uncharacterized protein YqiB (DUF1249 family)